MGDLVGNFYYFHGPRCGRERKAHAEVQGRERGFVFLLPFLLRATFELSRPVPVRCSCGCELSRR